MLIPLKDENPTESFAWVTMLLIVANLAAFAYELSLGPRLEPFVVRYGVIPQAIVSHPLSPSSLVRIFTSMFLHAGWIHVGGNMLYLWIFGNNVEDVLGHGRYILFYFACGVGAIAGHILSSPASGVVSLGASGAIAGVLAAYLVLYPHARVLTVIPILFFIEIARLPALVVIGLWIVLQVVAGLESLNVQVAQATGGVAWFAHIGGFATGIALILLLPRRRRPQPLPYDSRDW
jgi:membrane associated rhomboid family serine protease